MRLISIQLRVDKMLQVVHVVRAQARDRAGFLAVAGADVRRAVEGAVVARAFSEAVEPLGAVGLGAGPFADNGPLVRAGELGAEGAGGGDVLGGGLGDFVLGEDLVLMGVEDYVLVTGCGCHETVPVGREVLEGILDGGREVVAGSCHRGVAIQVEGFDLVHVEGVTEWFIEELDCRNDVSVAGITLSEVLNCGDCLVDGIALLPVDRSIAAAIVEAIL